MVSLMQRWAPGSWYLDFYAFKRPLVPVDDLAPEAGDVLVRARRNGAREGTPVFLDPAGRADALVNAFWRDPDVRRLKPSTVRRYARSLKVWLDFLHSLDVRWDQVSRSELAAFKEWRLSAEENPRTVVAGSFCVDQAAIHRFYRWAAEQHGVENPVRLRVIGETFFGSKVTRLEATPSGIRRADVKWLTPEAFRLWRNLGLRGFTADGMPSARWKGVRCLYLARDHHVVLGRKIESAQFRLESDPVQLDFEFLVPVGPAGQQFRADKNQPGRINLRDRDLDVVLLLPMRRNLPAVDHDGIATVAADESVADLQPGTSGPHEFPSAGCEYQAPAGGQKP